MTPTLGRPARTVPAGFAQLPYTPAVTRILPGLRRAFLLANRFVTEPMLRAGLGPLASTPWTGSLMILRTRGRRSNAWRSAPLGYIIRDGHVYCCAGFGRGTHWLRNLQADPRVEVLLPGRSVAGLAETVADPGEQVVVLRALLNSMPAVSRPLLGNIGQASDGEVLAIADALPLVRIRVTGLAPGPWDPGGTGWVLPLSLSAVLAGWWAWRRWGRLRRSV